jgi:hypothetical protein
MPGIPGISPAPLVFVLPDGDWPDGAEEDGVLIPFMADFN